MKKEDSNLGTRKKCQRTVQKKGALPRRKQLPIHDRASATGRNRLKEKRHWEGDEQMRRTSAERLGLELLRLKVGRLSLPKKFRGTIE